MPTGDKPPAKARSVEERSLALRARAEVAKSMIPVALFRDRGFSYRTIDALIKHGIDAPEYLLFATEGDLKNILGVGKASLEEIMRYRSRFIPG